MTTISLQAGREAWWSFLDRIEQARNQVGCSYQEAWYRGVSDESHDLVPSLLRLPARASEALGRVDKELVRLAGEWSSLRDQRNAANSRRAKLREAGTVDPTAEEEFQKTRSDMQAVREEQKRLDEKKKRTVTEFQSKCLLRDTLRELESDAFYRYSQRAGRSDRRSSWEIVAEMSHYGGKTRLLDWSESLSVAAFFALRKFREQLEPLWASDRESQVRLHRVEVGDTPCVWVLNPYLLSLYATDGARSSIWDFSFDESLDYYRTFGQGIDPWPYSFPIPIYPPWRDLRIAAQRGVFTVHGMNPEPLDVQRPGRDLRQKLERLGLVSKKIAQAVDLDFEAAVYGVYHLRRYEGLTHFVLFRDTDSLGRSVRDEMEEAKLFRMGWSDD